MTDLSGHKVLVTGCRGRIGAAVTRVLLAAGASVRGLDLSPHQDGSADGDGASAGSEPTGPGNGAARYSYAVCDVSDRTAVEAAINGLEGELGHLDGLVNAHGIFPNTALLDMDQDEWDRVFAVNTRGSMLTMQAMFRRWIARGSPGAIVNVSSCAATSPRAGGGHYSGSKAALDALTAVAAIEGGPYGIRANTVAPGLVLDEVHHRDGGEQLDPYFRLALEGTPLGRTGAPTDIARTVGFLLSDASSWTSGAVVQVSGGSHAGRTHIPVTGGLR